MRRRTIPCAIALGLLSVGCTAVTDATHATGYWTRQAIHDSQERHRNRRLAEAAWAEVRCSNLGSTASPDYSDGFKAGFADYLYRATTQTPPLPPKHYRELRYQTPTGYRAGEDWLAGFSHGIANARASGLRELVTGPSALPMGAPGPVSPESVSPPARLPVPPPIPPSDPLPLPRRIAPLPDDVKQPPEPDPVVIAPQVTLGFRWGRYLGPVAEIGVRWPRTPDPVPVVALAAHSVQAPARTVDAEPPIAVSQVVTTASYQTPATRSGPYIVQVSSARATLRASVEWVAVPNAQNEPAAVWAPTTPRPHPTIDWNKGQTEERNLPPSPGLDHREEPR